ncbi:MAG: hypothetical protein ACI8XU_000322 [Kiritimatiellia bacterium]|jgi:hypothetical protein
MKIRTLLLIPAALATITSSSMALSQEIVTTTPAASPIAPAPDTAQSLSSAHTVSALLAASLRDRGEMQLEAAYLKELNRKIQSQPGLVERELNLNKKQLAHVHQLLVAIENEDLRLTASRIEAMCEVWNGSAESATEDKRIREAFEVYQRLESADTFKNRYRYNFFTDINREIGPDASQAIQEHMHKLTPKSYATPYSWTDLVHTIGAELQQLKFSCDQSPTLINSC